MATANNQSRLIIDLTKILNNNDATEVKQMQTQFELHGWCFVTLPNELIPSLTMITELTDFFANDREKLRCSQHSKIYGYSKVDHKEGVKLLTGSYFNNFLNKGLVPRPGSLGESLNYLSQAFDAVTKRLIEILDQHLVFQQKPSLSTLIKHANLPLKDEHFGLQLKDRVTDQWIDGPLESNIGIIWLGEAASRITENRLKPGIHRVIYPEASKRQLTIWYELCTISQLENLSDKNKNERMATGNVIFNSLPNIGPIEILHGENKLEFLKRIEYSFGLSISKVLPPVYVLPKHQFSYSSNN